MKINSKNILIAIIIFSFLIRLGIALIPIEDLIQLNIIDDTFLGFGIAKNIVTGNGASYNGFDQTNGFQPLWLLIISPLFLLFSETLAIKLTLFLAVIIDTVTIFLLYMIGKKLYDEKFGLIAASLYGINPIIALVTINGIDTMLGIFLILLTFFMYIKKTDHKIIGILLGLCLLTRIDSVLFAIVIFADMLLKKVDTKKLLTTLVIFGLVIAPWFIWSYATFGTIFQSSTAAKIELAGNDYLVQAEETILDFVIGTGNRILKFMPIDTSHYFGAMSFSPIFMLYGIMILGLLVFGAIKSNKRLRLGIFYAILLILFFSIIVKLPSIRYLAPVITFIILTMSVALNKLKRIGIILLAIILITTALGGVQAMSNGYVSWQIAHIELADWIKTNIDEDATIGNFNSGILTFFSDRKSINLDGVVNLDVIPYIANKNIIEYMSLRNITYLTETDLLDHGTCETIEDPLEHIRYTKFLGDTSRLTLVHKKCYSLKTISSRDIDFIAFVYKLD